MEVALTGAESSVLQQALRSYLSELQSEIHHTDARPLRDELKHERETLEGVVSKLDEASRATELRDESGQGFVRLVSVWWSESVAE